MIVRTATVAAFLMASAALAEARVPLPEDKVIEDGLTLVAIGAYLDRNCEAISPKFWKSLNFARSLHKRARTLGYSDDEIDAYLDSEPDKARVEARARAYLVSRGVDPDNPETICTVGQAEISAGTSVGSFLKVN